MNSDLMLYLAQSTISFPHDAVQEMAANDVFPPVVAKTTVMQHCCLDSGAE